MASRQPLESRTVLRGTGTGGEGSGSLACRPGLGREARPTQVPQLYNGVTQPPPRKSLQEPKGPHMGRLEESGLAGEDT